MYCHNCGEARSQTASFCANCGAGCSVPPPSHGYTAPPYGCYQPPPASNKTLAAVSLACGLAAIMAPIPVLDIIAALVGIVLGVIACKENRSDKGLAIAGLVCSIIGLPISIGFTVRCLAMLP